MRRFFVVLLVAIPLAAQTPSLTILSFIGPITKCAGASSSAPAIVISTGPGQLVCAALPAGVTYSGNTLVFPNAGTQVIGETPAGTINGTNAAFALANTPISGTLTLYLNGLRMCTGTCGGVTADYSISGASITFNTGSIPQTGDILLADYRH